MLEKLKAKSVLTATVYLRNLGHYCELNGTSPQQLFLEARKKNFQNRFMDFVRRLEKEGKTGSYIARFKKVVLSWTRFNGIRLDLKVNIASEHLSHADDERVPTGGRALTDSQEGNIQGQGIGGTHGLLRSERVFLHLLKNCAVLRSLETDAWARRCTRTLYPEILELGVY